MPLSGSLTDRAGATSLRILLAEDNSVNERLAVRLLERQGHEVYAAHNGVEVLKALEARRFDVILMDVQMPVMDGLQCTRAIRGNAGPAERIPIIAMTAHAYTSDRDACLNAGMDGFITKPIDRQELYRVLETIAPAVRAAKGGALEQTESSAAFEKS